MTYMRSPGFEFTFPIQKRAIRNNDKMGKILDFVTEVRDKGNRLDGLQE
jgi:hypothetical protein